MVPDRTATVAVRVPTGDEGDLKTATRRRLERPESVETVEIRTVDRIAPGLGATVVTVEITVWTAGTAGTDLADRLREAPGVKRVADLER